MGRIKFIWSFSWSTNEYDTIEIVSDTVEEARIEAFYQIIEKALTQSYYKNAVNHLRYKPYTMVVYP